MHQINCLRGCTYDYSHIECVSLTFPWRLCMWLFNKVVALNIFSQYLQGSSMLMWMPWWVLSWWDCEKAFEHAMHEKGFSPVCVLLWCVRRAHLLKALSRSLHWKGLVWLCTFLCVFKCEDCEKSLLHYSQLNLITPACMSMSVFRCGLWLKLFSHCT